MISTLLYVSLHKTRRTGVLVNSTTECVVTCIAKFHTWTLAWTPSRRARMARPNFSATTNITEKPREPIVDAREHQLAIGLCIDSYFNARRFQLAMITRFEYHNSYMATSIWLKSQITNDAASPQLEIKWCRIFIRSRWPLIFEVTISRHRETFMMADLTLKILIYIPRGQIVSRSQTAHFFFFYTMIRTSEYQRRKSGLATRD